LAPFSGDDPDAAAAAALRRGLEAFEDGRWEDTLSNLEAAGGDEGPAPELVKWTRGRALAQLDRPWEALAVWHGIGADSRFAAEARLAEARVHLKAARAEEAMDALGGPEPPTGDHPLAHGIAAARAEILRAQAFRLAGGETADESAYQAYKRAWISSPTSGAGAEAETGMKALRAGVPEASRPTLADRVARAESLGIRHQNQRIIKLLRADRKALLEGAGGAPAVACAGTFQLGRAFHKRRLYRDSVPLLEWAGRHCPDDETTVKGLYLQAQGLSRSGDVPGSVSAFIEIADRYPDHSYADDGLHHAGRLEAAEGNHSTAERLFDRQIREFPEGDMAGATLWGRAHNLLTAGEPAAALPHLEQLASMDPGGPLRAAALQARYWLPIARMRVDPAAREAGIAGLATLAEEQPLDYYGVLALWKLQELDAGVAFEVNRRVTQRMGAVGALADEPDVHRPERAFMELPATRRAVALLRAGLGDEAGALITKALGDKAHERWNRDTLLFASHILGETGDAYRSHNVLRFAFRQAFPPLDDETLALFTHAYPPAFMEEIRKASTAHEFPALLFQGLVREESAFSPTIVSWAGAIGLSQLMWPTAKMTARKIGIRGLRKSHLRSPERNLEIGTAYFQELHERWHGHLPLAIASYNAGPGAVNRWIRARGDQTLDEWIEAIPYDQTRDYVKRVLGSFQIYNMLYDGTRAYVPLRVGPVRAALDVADPSFPPSG
jgi:soluble lytic murein transglycosylase